MRGSAKHLTRSMSTFSNWFEKRRHALALYLLFYNFCRVRETLGVTAAMAAGVVDLILGMEDCHSVTVATYGARPRSEAGRSRAPGAQRSDALIFSSAADPGQMSLASSVLSGRSTVLRWECRSSESGST
jgi:hypothetical protein